MWKRRVVTFFTVIAVWMGMSVTATSASSGSIEDRTAATHVASWWWQSAYYSSLPVCHNHKLDVARQGFPVSPSDYGCWREPGGYFFKYSVG